MRGRLLLSPVLRAATTGPVVLDHFTGLDGALLTDHTPDIAPPGAAWQALSGAWTIQSNTAKQALTDGAHYLLAIDPGLPNFTLQADITCPNALRYYYGLLLRYLDSSNYWFVTFYGNDGTPVLRLFERTAGTETLRAIADAPGTLGAATTLTVQLSGNDIIIPDYLTYSSAVGAGRSVCGLWTYADAEHLATGAWDNLQVNR